MSPRKAKQTAPSRLIKVSADGLLLPADATDWVAVYQPDRQLTWTRDVLPCGAVPWARAVKEAAAVTLCGWTDWRAPSRLDYAHLIDDDMYGPAIDTAFFTVADRYQWEWTGTKCTPSGVAWLVFLSRGYSGRYGQSVRTHVRAVRAGQISAFGGSAS